MLLNQFISDWKHLRMRFIFEVLIFWFILLMNPAPSCCRNPPAPRLSVFSPEMVKNNAKFYTVFEGHPVVVTCSSDSHQPVRSFTLFLKGVHELPAVDNAAHFAFPDANWRRYSGWPVSCIYKLDTSPEVNSSEAHIGISVTQPTYARLSGRESRCLGSLQLEHKKEWRAVSQQQWGLEEAAVVCRQLDCGSAISTDTQSGELQSVWRFYSDCDGSESALLGCGSIRDSLSVSTVSVLCSGILHRPTISLVGSNPLKPWDFRDIYIPHTFYINCSVVPQFPGGYFSVVFTGDKHSVTLNQTAVDHSAVFTIDLAEKAHSGNYSCIYYNTVFGHDFSSQSRRLAVIMKDSYDLLLDGGLENNSTKACSGKLLLRPRMSQMKMVTAETSGWDKRHASIVCRQLGCGHNAVSTSKIQLPNVIPMWRFYSDCDGSEATLPQCGYVRQWFSSKAIEVVCEG